MVHQDTQPFRSNFDWMQEDKLAEIQTIKQDLLTRGEDLIDMSMINPDIPPPRVLLDKLVEASLKPFNHRYSVSRGIRRLREAFAEKYASRWDVDLDAESEVCVTAGTKDAILDALAALASPGERVLLGSPCYPAHVSAARLAGLEIEYFNISQDHEAMSSEIELKLRSKRFKAVLLNFPNNPTGVSVDGRFFSRIARAVKDTGSFLLNDFVYGEMGFSNCPTSFLSLVALRDCAAETYSLSKAYSVPGWRVAALSGSSRLIHQVTRLKAHVDYGTFLPIQHAAAFALSNTTDLVKNITREYNLRCGTLATGLRKLNWSVENPVAGAFVWAKFPDSVSLDSASFAKEILNKSHTAVMPGLLFGNEFRRHVRFAAVVPEERIRAMLERLAMLTRS